MSEESKPCPFCAELIRAEAVKCRFCASLVGPGNAGVSNAAASDNKLTAVKSPKSGNGKRWLGLASGVLVAAAISTYWVTQNAKAEAAAAAAEAEREKAAKETAEVQQRANARAEAAAAAARAQAEEEARIEASLVRITDSACESKFDLFDSAIVISCLVANGDTKVRAARIKATLVRYDKDDVTKEQSVVLEPGENKDIRFEFKEYKDSDKRARCQCEVVPQ